MGIMKNSKKRNIAIVSSVAIVGLIVGLYFPISTAIEANNAKAQEEEKAAKLTSCLSQSGIGNYEKQIECYQQYGTESDSSKISKLQKDLKTKKLDDCLSKASSDYAVTDAEIESANNSASKAIGILQRFNNQYSAKIACYKSLGDGGNQSEISELESKISSNNEIIASAGGQPIYSYQSQQIDYPADHNYYAPTPEQVTTPSVDCGSYHAQYYNTYLQKVESAQRAYTTSLESASMECAARSGAQSGCNGIAEQKLKRELESKISTYKSEYSSSMSSVGCATSAVDL